MRLPSICEAPVQVAGDLLVGEGFLEVQYVPGDSSSDAYKALAAGDVHIALLFAGGAVTRIDMGAPLVLLGGIHVGCFELFGSARVHSVRDLKGKTVAVPGVGQPSAPVCGEHRGLRGPRPADRYSLGHPSRAGRHAAAGGGQDRWADGIPPEPQELRAKQIGHVVVNSTSGSPLVAVFLLYGRREP